MQIREAVSHEDLDEVTRIQREVWNVADIDIVGRIQLKASQHAGGSVLVALDDGGAIGGFSYAFPAFVKGETFWHSDLLAVRPQFRGTGMGQRLKWAQREHALREGVRRITWTFDPMQARNAHLNLELLGAMGTEYLGNFYGVTTSALHHGLRTDRMLASWELESGRVEARARNETLPASSSETRIGIPALWNDLVRTDVLRARAEQQRVADGLRSAFSEGLVVCGFDKPSSSYLLSPAAS